MRNLLAQFVYLQLLDVLTTLTFLVHGVQESNPLVQHLINATGSPAAGLAVTKILAFGVALFCWRRGKQKLLWGVNLFYSAVVVWNLVALLRSHGA
ncbi:MAG: DUF5658 family protein [Acidobacteria bacterium]|nr:DUF5658 family protein [Acidobacteriota bacterium]